jgi:hypothetical protein
MENLLVRHHAHAGAAVFMERAETFELPARAAQGDVLADDLNDVAGITNLSEDVQRSILAS